MQIMQDLKTTLFMTIACIFLNSQADAMYALVDGSQEERAEKYKKCEQLFKAFVQTDKCEKIFNKILFNKEMCLKVLFNGDKSCYNLWLAVPIQSDSILNKNKSGTTMIRKEITTLGGMLEAISHKDVALFKQKESLANELSCRIKHFFYEDRYRKITWDSATDLGYEFPSGTKEKVCINGFIECLSMLLDPKFYFETFHQRFALRCRIFTVVFVTLLLSYAGDDVLAMAKTHNLFMKY